jgi:hypothetical protein
MPWFRKEKKTDTAKIEPVPTPAYLFSTEVGYRSNETEGLIKIEDLVSNSRNVSLKNIQEKYNLKGLSYSNNRIFVEAPSLEEARIMLLSQKSREFTKDDLTNYENDVLGPIIQKIRASSEESINNLKDKLKVESEKAKKDKKAKSDEKLIELERQVNREQEELEKKLEEYKIPEEVKKTLSRKTVYEAVFGLEIDYEKAAEGLH